MNLNLRNKLVIGFVILDIFLSIVLGVTMYIYSIDMFIADFRTHKLSIARFIANSIKGEIHQNFNSHDKVKDPMFREYFRIVNGIYRQEITTKYIYTLNYRDNKLTYGIDANIINSDTIWVESQLVSFFVFMKNGLVMIDYDYQLYKESFSIDLKDKGEIRIEINQKENIKSVSVEGQEVVRIIQDEPMKGMVNSTLIDLTHRAATNRIKVHNQEVNFIMTFSEKNAPGTDPGAPFVESEEVQAKIIKLIKTNTDYIDEEPISNAYGYFLSAYAILKDNTGDGIGIVIVDVDSREISEFKSKFTIAAISISITTFILTIILSLLLAKYFTLPLEVLSEAVATLAAGDMDAVVKIDSNDEFGSLGKSFNVMITNLKIASEVQFNLISEISHLNEGLEEKVVERTKTIKAQSLELEKQIQIAKKIQLSLLPAEIPHIPNAKVSFRYQPMQSVGGDFLDFYHKNESELSLFICDVSGHGVPAAFLATMVKMALQDCYEMRLGPVESIQRIHKSLAGKMTGHFISGLFCTIDLNTGIMRSANAGHLPFIHLKPEGHAKYVLSKGRVINELFNPDPKEEVTQLEKGDKIILYTDGITEARNNRNEMFGDERLLSLVSEFHSFNTTELCNNIYHSILSYTGNSQNQFEDDITILVTEFNG
ncbi:MAG: SpoIIE family protein phosphatase [Leptospiraceae bacterium]|nr:SpoIIE family protein phosphatase [Leptospiraceae bacterium]